MTKQLRFIKQLFFPSIIGILREKAFYATIQRARYMFNDGTKITPFTFDGFLVDTPAKIVNFWWFVICRQQLNHWPKYMPDNPRIIDIGANNGIFAWWCRRRWPNAWIIGIEPHPDYYEECKNLKYKDKLVYDELYNIALSDKNEKLMLHRCKKYGTATFYPAVLDVPMDDCVEVRCIKGDYMGKTNDKFDMIKIDVDGHEDQVIDGMVDTLKNSRFILLEITRGNLKEIEEKTGHYDTKKVGGMDYLLDKI